MRIVTNYSVRIVTNYSTLIVTVYSIRTVTNHCVCIVTVYTTRKHWLPGILSLFQTKCRNLPYEENCITVQYCGQSLDVGVSQI